MNNYKIKVNSKNESKEAQELFESLGYEKGMCSLGNYPAVIVTTQDWATGNYCSTRALGLDIPAHDNYTEITLEDLRDMVVLKRNSIDDATHINTVTDSKVLQQGNKNYYWYSGEWHLYPCGVDIRPIGKTMKEYLVKTKDGEYHYINDSYDTCPAYVDKIEIPEGATFYAEDSNKGVKGNFFFKLRSNEFDNEAIWLEGNWMRACFDVRNMKVLWKCPTQPEALPFIDDDPMTMENQIKHSDKEMFDKIRNGDIKLDFSQFDQDDSEKGSTLITVPLIDDAPAGDKKIYTHDELNRMSDDDVVNHPNHYTQGKVECINALEAATVGKVGIEAVCVANVIKYLWRYEEKNGKEDIKKAQWYLNKLLDSID